jgi:hypothetical protein
MRVTAAESTELFGRAAGRPRQVVAGEIDHAPGRTVLLTVEGQDVTGDAVATAGEDGTVRAEIPVTADGLVPGDRREVTLTAVDGLQVAWHAFEFTAAEPGWTMFMVSHFHYDPVWWNTQGACTGAWDVADDPATTGLPAHTFDSRGQSGTSLVRAHCDLARRDPACTFVLAEVDYLKPYWDSFPEERAFLRELMRTGRVEIMGGTYNEPNTDLTGAEATVRDALFGDGFQRGIMGGSPETAWQLDAFGHDPQFPGLMADAGISSNSWARGPFHQWGPALSVFGEEPRDPGRMQFPAEFSWIAPSGRGLLTACMVNHYGTGWAIDNAPTLPATEAAALKLFRGLSSAALTRNVLLPVGGDYAPPCRWVMDIHRDGSARYVWPRFISGTPRDFFAAVRAELDAEGRKDLAADPGHEPRLHRLGRLLHRHQAGPAVRRDAPGRRGGLGGPGLPGHRAPLPGRGPRQGLAATDPRRPPRRHHRLRGPWCSPDQASARISPYRAPSPSKRSVSAYSASVSSNAPEGVRR